MKLISHLRPGRRKPSYLENTLTLKIPSDELFEPMVLAPHAELNPKIHEIVADFARRRRRSGPVSITVFTEKIGPLVQEKFKELFREHCEDMLRSTLMDLNMVYLRLAVFIALTVANVMLWDVISNHVWLSVIQNVWAFALWKIGDTFIDSLKLLNYWRHLRLVRDASIHFYILKGRNKTNSTDENGR